MDQVRNQGFNEIRELLFTTAWNRHSHGVNLVLGQASRGKKSPSFAKASPGSRWIFIQTRAWIATPNTSWPNGYNSGLHPSQAVQKQDDVVLTWLSGPFIYFSADNNHKSAFDQATLHILDLELAHYSRSWNLQSWFCHSLLGPFYPPGLPQNAWNIPDLGKQGFRSPEVGITWPQHRRPLILSDHTPHHLLWTFHCNVSMATLGFPTRLHERHSTHSYGVLFPPGYQNRGSGEFKGHCLDLWDLSLSLIVNCCST